MSEISQLIEALVKEAASSNSPKKAQLLAKARYNNVAESPDELSFRQGDVVTVVQKDFNKQVDWWLCELRGKVGMVPANYFEVFHNHDSTSEYDVPRPSSKKAAATVLSSSSSSLSGIEGRHSNTATPSSVPLPCTESAVPLPSAAATAPSSRPLSCNNEDDVDGDGPIYDIPPTTGADVVEATDCDYDLPPSENDGGGGGNTVSAVAGLGYELYNRPPSSNRGGSPIGSTRSSMKSMNRISTASSAASSTGIYDVPPDLTDVYDFPKSSQPARGFEAAEPANVLQAIDISSLMDDEAEDMLRSYCQVITATYDALFSTVYGPDAYWGTDHKAKRMATLKTSMAAAKHFDKAVLILLQFGKGVVNRMEYISDVNFKKKYLSAFKGLLHSRNDILGKLEALNSEAESITGTIKSLLEIARTVPRAVTEFTVLLQANKAILFRTSSSKSGSSLPVITKNDVKSRPLPDLPQPLLSSGGSGSGSGGGPDVQEGDYAIPVEGGEESVPVAVTTTATIITTATAKLNVNESNLDYNNTLNKRRKPNDILPPLPFATLPRSGGGGKASPGQKAKAADPQQQQQQQLKSPHGSKSNLQQQSPAKQQQQQQQQQQQPIDVAGGDYDEIDRARDRSVVLTSRPSIVSLGSNSSRGPSPTHLRIRRQGSLSSCSSSDDLNNSSSSGIRRANSTELLDSPYGRPSPGHRRQHSSPQPLKMEEKMILDRFAKQFDLIVPGLRDSIDLLLKCLQDNEAPKDFVTKSKLTVVAAYKLVYVADALSQKIVHNETKASITASSNDLTESIKDLVAATKTAALQYPSVIALDKMGGSLKQLYPCALDLINSVKRAN